MRTMRIQDLLAQQALQRDLASDPYGENSQISVDVPQNYMTSSSGMAYDFGPSQTSLGGVQGLDYASGPVEYMGQKGFRLAGDPFTVQLANGQRLRLGEDTAATQTRNDAQSKRIGSLLANEQTQLENEQKRMALNAPKPLTPTELKRQDAMTARNEAKSAVSRVLADMDTTYDQLKGEGAVISPDQSWLSNVMARAVTSAPGQMIGGTIGTNSQRNIDELGTMRPLLIQQIAQATGMSSKQMDSNKELQFYLQAATDPTKGLEANKAALRRLDKMYGLGNSFTDGIQDRGASGSFANQPSASQAKEGALSKSKSGKPIVYRNGQWVYLK